MPVVKGTSSVSDSRALSKALKQTKFPKHFSLNVKEWSRIQRSVIVKWIERKITTLLGFEDEIVSNTAVNLFLPPPDSNSTIMNMNNNTIDPRKAQIDLVGFLGEDDAAQFASELWEMLLDASTQPTGIPRKIIEEKKKELLANQERQQQKALEQQIRYKDQSHRKEKDYHRPQPNSSHDKKTISQGENVDPPGGFSDSSRRKRWWGDKNHERSSGELHSERRDSQHLERPPSHHHHRIIDEPEQYNDRTHQVSKSTEMYDSFGRLLPSLDPSRRLPASNGHDNSRSGRHDHTSYNNRHHYEDDHRKKSSTSSSHDDSVRRRRRRHHSDDDSHSYRMDDKHDRRRNERRRHRSRSRDRSRSPERRRRRQSSSSKRRRRSPSSSNSSNS